MVVRPWTIIKHNRFVNADATSFDDAYRMTTSLVGAGDTVEVNAENKVIDIISCRHIKQDFIMEMTRNLSNGEYEHEPVGRYCTKCGATTERWM